MSKRPTKTSIPPLTPVVISVVDPADDFNWSRLDRNRDLYRAGGAS